MPKNKAKSRHWRSFNWNKELNWRDMLVDAPSLYSPSWLGAITNKELAAHCNKLYMRLRKDMDNGNGVSLMRDLVLRRIVWSVRILERVEQAIVEWDGRVDEGERDAERMLSGYMDLHRRQCRLLNESIELILVEMPPMKTVEQFAGRKAHGDGVRFSENGDDL